MASVPAPLPQVTSPVPNPTDSLTESHAILTRELRRLTRFATLVAILTSPSVYYWFHHHNGWSVGKALFVTFVVVVIFRGLVDLLVRKALPWPSLFGTDDARLREEDIVNRRRAWTWRWFVKWFVIRLGGLVTAIYLYQLWKAAPGANLSWFGTLTAFWTHLKALKSNLALLIQVFFFFIFNFLIFMGPMLLMGISQIRGYEPGDAEWGVKLDHVRGQAEAKEEIRRIVTLWQSGEVFERRRRQARARPPLPRSARHRQDDDGQGNRDWVQLAVRLDPGLGLCPDLHRHRRDHRALPRPQGEEARQQVGRPVHRLHRRDRRSRHAPPGARWRRRRSDDARAVRRPSSSGPGARSIRAAT